MDDMSIKFDIRDMGGELLDKAEDLALKDARTAGKAGAELSKELCPIKSGNMQKGIVSTTKRDIHEITMECGGKDFKTPWFCFGTEKMRKNDFITPGFELAQKEFEEKFAVDLNALKDLT